jgi:hypothetical protein
VSTDFRDDPRWQAAHSDYVADPGPDENDDDVFVQRIRVAHRMYVVECEHLGTTPMRIEDALAQAEPPSSDLAESAASIYFRLTRRQATADARAALEPAVDG